MKYFYETLCDMLFWLGIIGFSGFWITRLVKDLLDFLLDEEEEEK